MIGTNMDEILGVQVVTFPSINDSVRGGCLTFGQCADHIPFIPKRFFYVYNVPGGSERGAHAHRTVNQCLICLKGSILVSVDNGTEKRNIKLDKPSLGVVMEKMIWSTQQYLENDTVLLVLASEEFKEEEYIRDYTEYTRILQIEYPIHFVDLKPTRSTYHALSNAFDSVLKSGMFVLGPDVACFEKDWAAYCDASFCVGVGSGLDALCLMLRAAEFEVGSEVIVPANTYIATLLGVTMADLVPVLVEPDLATFNIDIHKIEASITKRTKAILAVDLYGLPADRDGIALLASKYGLKMFCDAAQSHGARYKNAVVGGLYDATAFSFYPSKNLGALGEAGAVVTNDKHIAERIRLLRNYGSKIRYENEMIGTNSRLDTIQAAFLRVKLSALDDCNVQRCNIANFYIEHLSCLSWLILPVVDDSSQSAWHQFVIQCQERDRLRVHLDNVGIPSLIHYPIPPHLSKAYSNLGFNEGAFPVTEKLARTILSLPIGPHLTYADAKKVVDAIKSFKPAGNSLYIK